MDRDEQAEARWPIDLEEVVAKNVRWLRESRGLSQQELGSDLALHGFGMHYTTVAQLEVGARPLRLNEVAAIAALFEVPIESLWEKGGLVLNERETAAQDERRATAQAADAEQHAPDYYTEQRNERLRDKWPRT
ncbi:MAG TPA: helix-turn-helix transcriptional regulator [Dermatophilaceae bacterium]|nr:helix-turn-helix transcriptional regulator [Dermatophilaceae bacterium]